MKYFKDCQTIDQVKKIYRELAKKFHPDHGGSTEIMQELNKEYSFICAKLAAGQKFTNEEKEATILEAEKYREALEKIINLPGINIELVGTWIWVTGNTYPVKSQLKEANFYFASKKVAWYFRSEENKVQSYGKKMELDQIRAKYGTEKIKGSSFTSHNFLHS